MSYRSVNPGLLRIIRYHASLLALLETLPDFAAAHGALSLVQAELGDLKKLRSRAAQAERAAADHAVASALEDQTLPADFRDEIQALDTRWLDDAIRVLSASETALRRQVEDVIQQHLDELFAHLHDRVTSLVAAARNGPADAPLRADYAEARSAQRTLLRQVGFGLADWRSAAIVRGSASQAGNGNEPPWPYDDLDDQLAWFADHPEAEPWVPSPTVLESQLSSPAASIPRG